MISFEQFCKSATSYGKCKWFYFDRELLQFLTADERMIVHIEELNDGFIRMWYPAEAYVQEQKRIVSFKNTASILDTINENSSVEDLIRIQQALKERKR